LHYYTCLDNNYSEFINVVSTPGIAVLLPSYYKLDGCIVWNAHNTVLGAEVPLIYIVPVCYVKTGRYGKT